MIESIPIKRYSSVGHCIYCGAQGEGVLLTEEHIIPRGLGGWLILPDASCERCRKITGEEIEQTCLRAMFGPTRDWQKLRRKRGKSDRFKLKLQVEANDQLVEVDAPLPTDRIDTIQMMAFPPPLILEGQPPVIIREMPTGWVWANAAIGKDVHNAARKAHPNASRVITKASFEPILFSRMLAKIAHGYAVAVIGLCHFTPFLTKGILGEEPWFPGYYVGGDPNPIPPSKSHIEIGWIKFTGANGREYVVVKIRIFGHLGAPLYHVVVGEPKAVT